MAQNDSAVCPHLQGKTRGATRTHPCGAKTLGAKTVGASEIGVVAAFALRQDHHAPRNAQHAARPCPRAECLSGQMQEARMRMQLVNFMCSHLPAPATSSRPLKMIRKCAGAQTHRGKTPGELDRHDASVRRFAGAECPGSFLKDEMRALLMGGEEGSVNPPDHSDRSHCTRRGGYC